MFGHFCFFYVFSKKEKKISVMKSIVLLTVVFLTFYSLNAQFQQFGSTKTIGTRLGEGHFEVGVNPFIMIHKGENPEGHKYSGIAAVGGYAMNQNLDFRITAGLLIDAYDLPKPGNTKYSYFGAEFEGKVLSTGRKIENGIEVNLGGGIHAWQNHAGFDGTVKVGLRTSQSFHAYTGLDLDFNFYVETVDNTNKLALRTLYRAPLGLEISPSSAISIILEAGVPISEYDHFTAGGGLRLFINHR